MNAKIVARLIMIVAAIAVGVTGCDQASNGKAWSGVTAKTPEGKHVKVLIFSAVWCGPCRQLPPVLEELHKRFPTVEFQKLNFDDQANKPLVAKYDVDAIPNFVLLVDDRQVGQIRGLTGVDEISNYIMANVPGMITSAGH